MGHTYAEALAGNATSVPLLEGDAGTEQTIALIRQEVDQALRDPVVRQAAGAIVSAVRPYNDAAEVRAIYDWVLRNIRFTKDPYGKETISSARWTLTHRFGDCDDINAVLLPSLLGAVGYQTRLVTISSNPHVPEQFSHVYAEVLLRGRWVPIDAARPNARFGSSPARHFRKRVWSLTSEKFQDVQGLSGYYLGFDWGGLIKQITTGATQIISAVRVPKTSLVPPMTTPSTPVVYQPPPSSGFDTNTLLIGAALIGGAYLLARRSKG